MGVLPLQFPPGKGANEFGLTGVEEYSIVGLAEAMADGGPPPATVRVSARTAGSGADTGFDARVRIDTPREADYFRQGGILQFVLRNLLAA
jgi:aconitate hydratase